MRLLPDPDALELAAAVRQLLERGCDPAALRAAWGDPLEGTTAGRVPGLWKRLADVGVPGLTVAEEHGGAGMDVTAAVPVLVEAGRAAAPEPLVETLAGATLLASAGGVLAQEWLPRIAAGDAVVAIGEGPDPLVAAAGWADLLLLADGTGTVHALTRDQVSVRPAPSLDRGVRLGVVSWRPGDGVVVAGADRPAAYDVACVAVAAQLVGLATAMLDMSVAYAKVREQFGKPIGSFQAVKQQLADVYVGNAFAAPVVHRAAWSAAHDLPSRARDASHAMHAAIGAAQQAARTALQVHAGIGYTFEHDLHIWMKRTWTLSSVWGGVDVHRARVAAAVLDADAPPRVP